MISETHKSSLQLTFHSSLSSPQLAHQFPLPPHTSPNSTLPDFDRRAALAFPASDAATKDFILAPVLTLPPAFGATHVGETFACTLCVSEELPSTGATAQQQGVRTSVRGVKITAEMQTPSQTTGVPLELEGADGDEAEGNTAAVDTAARPIRRTHQRIVRWELREEGTHVLAVTVAYTETREAEDGSGGALGGKVRTFKKLYQFAARPLLSVRTKSQRLPRPSKNGRLEMVLEAQLENVADVSVMVDGVELREAADGLKVKSLNRWEAAVTERPRLNPRDVLQVAFLLSQASANLSEDDRATVPLGHLEVTWRGSMGEKGLLQTGSLTCKR